MSYTVNDWRDHDERAAYTYYKDPDYSIYFPHEDRQLSSAIRQYLSKRNLDADIARRFGWYPARYRGPRIIIPCIRTDFKNFWQARWMDGAMDNLNLNPGVVTYKRWESPYGTRGDALCFLNMRKTELLVLVEGPMDALAAAMCGVSAVATLGVGVPGPVLAHVATLAQGHDKVLIVPDRDEMGAWIRIQSELGRMGVPTEIREPAVKDLADMAQDKREELLRG